jgi:hypothetical protein
MLRTINRYGLMVGATTLAICFWNRSEIPGSIAFRSELEHAPQQQKLEKEPFTVSYSDVDYRVEPLYEYQLYGMIVSFRQHDGESFMHRMANDHLNMADLCVVWSDTAFSEHLRKLKFWNGIFTCNVSTTDTVAWSHFKMDQLSNNHLISADPAIRARVADVRIGDQIRIKGWLSKYGAVGGPVRGTSTTREDAGNGACETIFVNDFEIIQAAFSPWRFGMYLSLVMLAVCLAIHFAMPYRPYRN